MALFQGSTGKPVPECQRSGFYWSKDDAGGGNNWSYKTNHQQTSSRLSTGQMPYLSPPTNCVSARQEKVSHSTDLVLASSPGVFRICLYY